MDNKTCITAGKFMDMLLKITDSPKAGINEVTKTPIKMMGKRKAVELLAKSKMTVREIFEKCNIPVDFTEDDKSVLQTIERLSKEQKAQMLQFVRRAEEPWWVKTMEAPIDTMSRLSILLDKRYLPHLKRTGMYTQESAPLLHNLVKIAPSIHVETDDVPELAREVGCPIAYLMNLPLSDARFYSHDPDADRLFSEYKMMNPSTALIPQTALQTAKRRCSE